MNEGLDQLLAGVVPTGFTGAAFRHQAPAFDPRSGSGARRHGGRFNPPGSFAVLYLCLDLQCVSAELWRLAETQGLYLAALLPREIYRYDVRVSRALDLRGSRVCRQLGLGVEHLTASARSTTQAVGEAALRGGYQAVVSPAATGTGCVLALLVNNLGGTALAPRLIETWRVVEDVPECGSA